MTLNLPDFDAFHANAVSADAESEADLPVSAKQLFQMINCADKLGLSEALSGEMKSLVDRGTYDVNEKIDMNTIARQVIGH